MVSYATNARGSGTSSLSQGSSHHFKENERHSWGPSSVAKDPLTVLLATNDGNLLRNTCSAILDANKLPYLASTPFWLKTLFWVLSIWPAGRAWLTSALLFVQIQAMNHFYGYHGFHGHIPLLSLWYGTFLTAFSPAPDYFKRLQWRSTTIFSNIVQFSCYWAGWTFLGMKGSYREYTPT